MGATANFIFTYIIGGSIGLTDPWQIFMNIFGENFFSLSQPIIGIALGAMITFPLIFRWPWKRLAAAALGVALIEGAIVYFVSIPDYFLLNLAFTDPFCVMKGIPMMLYGAAIGKLVLGKADFKKPFLIAGGIICAAYVVVPALLGYGLTHMFFVIWVYPHAMLFMAGSAVLMLGIFQYLDEANINTSAFAVLGRTSFIVYCATFMVLIVMVLALNKLGVPLALPFVMVELVITTAAVWGLMYAYGRWRWGHPSKWYQSDR